MKKQGLLSVSILLVAALSSAGPSLRVSAGTRAQAAAPGLGTVGSFAVLGASAVTNTGATVLDGNLGISPGDESSISGFPPGIFTGTLHAGDASALQAQYDAASAYDYLHSQTCNANLTGQDLGGLILTPGVYCFDSSAQLTGNLVLNALGDPNAVWIFRMGSTLAAASGSSVDYINSPQPLCNVFWQVGSSATLGTGVQMMGNILAVASVTLNTGAGLLGRAVALTAAVTLDNNAVDPVFCALGQTATPTDPDTPTATILPASPTSTLTATPTNTITPTAIIIPTNTLTATPTNTISPTATIIPTSTLTATLTKTNTPTVTLVPGAPTWTPTATPSKTNTPTATILTASPTTTRTFTPTNTPSASGSPTRTPSTTTTNTSTRTATITPGAATRTRTTSAAKTNTRTPTLLTGGSPTASTAAPLLATLSTGVVGLPNSGGAPIRADGFPWSLIYAGGFGVLILILGVLAHRRTHKQAQ